MNSRFFLFSTLLIFYFPKLLADVFDVYEGQSIQSAINSATDGDEIHVHEGTYEEFIDFQSKTLQLIGVDGPQVTILDVSNLVDPDDLEWTFQSVITLTDNQDTSIRIEGFTIMGGVGRTVGADREGGGIYLNFARPTIKNCIIQDNHSGAGGGMAAISASLAKIIDSLFQNNTAYKAGSNGGGGLFIRAGGPIIVNSIFRNNRTIGAAKGGGISAFLGNAQLLNVLIEGNEARHGGGIMADKSSFNLKNVTIVNNTAVSGGGGGMRSIYSNSVNHITNSIFWGNSAGTAGDEIYDQAGAISTLTFTDIEGGWTGAGSDNMNIDPMFVDFANANYRLSSSSPLIDAGNNAEFFDDPYNYFAGLMDYDLDGNDRLFEEGIIDLGSYEYQGGAACPADIDGDGIVQFFDLISLLTAWGECIDPSDCPADLDSNGEVGQPDLLILLASWGVCRS